MRVMIVGLALVASTLVMPAASASCAIAGTLYCTSYTEDEYGWDAEVCVAEGAGCSWTGEFADNLGEDPSRECTGVRVVGNVRISSCSNDSGGYSCVGNRCDILPYLPLPWVGNQDQVQYVADLIDSQIVDEDSDGVLDAAESTFCGREAVRNAIAGPGAPGECASPTDLVLPDGGVLGPYIEEILALYDLVIETYEDVYDATYGMVDNDGDWVPDALEPSVCTLEDQNMPADGTCVGSDYDPPL